MSFSLVIAFVLGFILAFLEAGVAYGLYYLFKTYSQAHTGRLANKVEYRQLIALLVVSKGFYDEADGELTYFPKIAVRFNFDTGQFFLVEPVDGQRYMEQFSSGRFDKVVEIALLADKETTEFKKNKMVSTFAFDPIKFRYQLKEYGNYVRSITADNGSEFRNINFLEYVQKDQKTKVYYAHPSSPQERGTNEYKNRELRRYVPKKTTFNKLTQEELTMIMDKINRKPMLKALDGDTPKQRFEKEVVKMNRYRRNYLKKKTADLDNE
ncbi:IS30 family transposase [Fructobacillus sp. M131]|nr:IS30 family transposase [Fructobacillus cardui]MCK8627052.1 IS30 family transposase [Fructobacillus cardui]